MQTWRAIESLRWIGLISLWVILITGAVPVFKRASSLKQSVSQLWALDSQKHTAISIILTICGAGMCASALGWLIPTYQLWPGMYPIIIAGYLALLAVAWFPIHVGPGEHSLLHPHFVGGAIAATGATIGYMCILLAPTEIPRVSYYMTIIALVYSVTWPAFMLRGVRNYFIVLEGTLVLLFVTVVTTLALVR